MVSRKESEGNNNPNVLTDFHPEHPRSGNQMLNFGNKSSESSCRLYSIYTLVIKSIKSLQSMFQSSVSKKTF